MPSLDEKLELVQDTSLTKIKPNQDASEHPNRQAASPSPIMAMFGIEEISIPEQQDAEPNQKKAFSSFNTDEMAEPKSDSLDDDDDKDLFSTPKNQS